MDICSLQSLGFVSNWVKLSVTPSFFAYLIYMWMAGLIAAPESLRSESLKRGSSHFEGN